MPSFGDKLKGERESRNKALEDVAGVTKIGRRYLEALEHDEFEELPGPAFGKFYIRAYAKALGFDPEPWIEEYDREQMRRLRDQEEAGPHSAEVDADDAVSVGPIPRQPETQVEPALIEPTRFEEPAAAPPDESVEPVDYVDSEDTGLDALPPEAIEPIDVPASLVVTEIESAAPSVASVDETATEKPDGPDQIEAVQIWLGAVDDFPAILSRSRWIVFAAPLVAIVLVILLVWVALAWIGSGGSGADAGSGPVEATATEPASREPTGAGPSGAAAAEAKTPQLREPTPEQTRPAPPTSPEVRAAPASTARLSVPEFGVGRRIVDRRLADPDDRFEEGEIVWFWTRVTGGRAGETVRHVWFHEGSVMQSIDLKLGAGHWRTQSSKTLWGAGSWTVEAQDHEGTVLARASFTCEP